MEQGLEETIWGRSQSTRQRRLLARKETILPQPWQEIREKQTDFPVMSLLVP